MMGRILLPLDGSARAGWAIPYVTAVARAFGSDVVLLRVVEGGPPGVMSPDPVEWRLERGEALSYLEEVKADFVRADIPVDIDVGVGQPAEAILEAARARRADLIALTTHGRGEALGVALAGTAHKVISGAGPSVLVLPASSEREAPGLRRIVVGLDGSPRGEWALCVATTLARTSGVPLVLVHVVPSPEILDVGDTEHVQRLARELVDTTREAADIYLAGLISRIQAPDLRLSSRVIAADTAVARVLGRVTTEEPGSLLVLSARGSAPANDRTYGSVALALVGSGEHPVLVLRDRPASSESPPERAPDRARRGCGEALPAV